MDYGVIFCGGGPAGIGPIIAASAAGKLDELLDRGVLVIEPGPVGPGGMSHYAIPANSLGGAFLEGLDSLTDPAFDAVRHAPETAALRAASGIHPPLETVGAFLRRLGDAVVELLDAHPRCGVLAGATVEQVELVPGGVRVTARRTGTTESWTAERAVLAMGGTPFDGFERTTVLPGVTVSGDHVLHGEDLIDRRRQVPEATAERIRRTRQVVIVGGAHSAWSVAGLLLTDPRLRVDGQPPDITILHRAAIRLFYTSAEAARADGYAFDPVLDVCAASGRVNRYGGLRGAAHELASGALGLTSSTAPIRLVSLEHSNTAEVREVLDAAGAVVVATGYQARLPQLRDESGAELRSAVARAGTEVTADAHLIDVSGTAHPELLAYGLGAGLAPSAQVGGEPSYDRRADGIWLYQHDVGRLVLDQLLGTTVHETGDIHA